MMLTLVFLRFIGEKYEDGIEVLRQTLIDQGLDPDDEAIRAAFFDDATLQTEHTICLLSHAGLPLSIHLHPALMLLLILHYIALPRVPRI